MGFKRMFKRSKKKKDESGSHGNPSRADTPPPDPRIQTTCPTPVQSLAISALTLQPFVPPPTPPVPSRGLTDPDVTNTEIWPNLTTFVNLLQRTPILSPLTAAMDDLRWFVGVHKNVSTTRKEYYELRTHLERVSKDLCAHFSGNTPPSMTTGMLHLFESIRAEIRLVYGTQDRDTISRYMQAEQDLDKLARCYRRIQGHLERIMLNANLNIWRIVDTQITEARLDRLNPSISAIYDSAEANVVQRRECAVNTRKQVLLDLNAWKDNLDGEKVCWMNGMAGTGKTTIATTLCSSLSKSHELGASFFCTRSIPTCRDVKLILPTISYQLARFSDPFRGALLRVLEQDPDVHMKVPRVQFKRMIREPLQEVMRSLPLPIVVVMDALDECDDSNGVEQILDVLLENATDLPVKFLVSSRPEYHIRTRISKSALKTKLVLHELEEKMVKADIETYLRTELALILVPVTNAQLTALVERAGALFIYAATLVRYIKGGDTLGRLAAVLKAPGLGIASNKSTKEIDKLYDAVLTSTFNIEDQEQFEKEQIELVLHTVVCAQEPLTINALAGLLNIEYVQVLDALKPLWSVIHVSESNTAHRVSTLHASFPDYLLDSKRSQQYVCNVRAHNDRLAELCLTRIQRNPCQYNVCGLSSSYVFDSNVPVMEDRLKKAIPLDLLYACRYWAIHLSLGGMSDKLAELLYDFLSKRLLFWMEILNLAKQINLGIGLVQKSINWLTVKECFERTTLLARDARRFVAVFAASPVSRSTPHLYVSMLASWPSQHPISHHYSRQTVGLVQIKGIETAERQHGLLSLVPVGPEVVCVAYSPNGRFFASRTGDQRVLIWDATSCQMVIDPIGPHTDQVQAIAISPNGAQICSGSNNNTLCVWDPQDGQQLAGPLKGHTNTIWSVAYSPDGRWLVSGSLGGSVIIWSTESWEKIAELVIGHEGRVLSIVFSPDSSFIAASFESAIHLWNPSSNQRIGQPLEGHTSYIVSLVFLPDGQHIVSGSDDRTIRVWDTDSGQIAFGPFQEHLATVCSLAVSLDGKHLVSASDDNTMRIWDTSTWQTRAVIQLTGVARSVTFSNDGSQLVSGSADGNVLVWNFEDLVDSQQVHNQSEGHHNWVRSVAFSLCGTYIVSGSHDTTVCMWEPRSGHLLHSPLKGHNNIVISVGVSADSNHIFSVSMDRMIHVWDGRSGELEYTIGPLETDGNYGAHYQQNWPVAFIFDGKRVACGSQSGRIYMWEDSNLSYSRAAHNSEVTSIAFSPDGQLFASGSQDGKVMIWHASSGNRLFDPCEGHSGPIRSIAFSSDGSYFASGSQDWTIRIWSTNAGSQVGDALEGHLSAVRSIAFSPCGNRLVSGSEDLTVRTWDVVNGQSTAIFNGHTSAVLSVAFSPDGAQVVSGSVDKAIRLWIALPTVGDSTTCDTLLEDPPKEVTNAINSSSTPEWEIDQDGWVRDSQDHLLLWVPPDLRSILLAPQNTVLISHQGCIELKFADARIGDVWETCYKPQ